MQRFASGAVQMPPRFAFRPPYGSQARPFYLATQGERIDPLSTILAEREAARVARVRAELASIGETIAAATARAQQLQGELVAR